MPVYVFRDGKVVNRETGEPMNAEGALLAAPQVFGDLPGYQSPIDGKWIDGRRARAYDMESNGCVDANDMKPATTGKLRNAKFAAKHGLTHMLERER